MSFTKKPCPRCNQLLGDLPHVLESQSSGIGYRKRHLECPVPSAPPPPPMPEPVVKEPLIARRKPREKST